MKRIAARIDANQREIVLALRKAGCSVLSLASMGKGCPDLLVARCGGLWLMEVKDGSKPLSRQRLTPLETAFKFNWKSEVHVVYNIEQALRIAKAL